jgi:predicted ATPase with chaperone activity
VGGAARFPCELILVAAMNPCPCARDGESICRDCGRRVTSGQSQCECGSRQLRPLCVCTASQKEAYKGKLSGAIMDRIDLKIRVGARCAGLLISHLNQPQVSAPFTCSEPVELCRPVRISNGRTFGIN